MATSKVMEELQQKHKDTEVFTMACYQCSEVYNMAPYQCSEVYTMACYQCSEVFTMFMVTYNVPL